MSPPPKRTPPVTRRLLADPARMICAGWTASQ